MPWLPRMKLRRLHLREWFGDICLIALALTALRPSAGATATPPAAMFSVQSSSIPTSLTAQSTVTLYDGALNTGTPDTQGFTYVPLNITSPPILAMQTFASGVTTLDTMPKRSDLAGYFSNSALYPPLDRIAGYQVVFTTQVITEAHVSNDRAGFSVLVLSSDQKGIELGFWTNEIWAQEGGAAPNLFTHAEGQAFTTTTGLITYTLTIVGNLYLLDTDGSPVLSGSLRDYTTFSGFPNPYTTPNLIFLGDDTASAQATIKLSAMRVTLPLYPIYLPLILKDTVGGP